ncbi:MAG TPA: hypothetical protein ENN60_02295 [archaeon]|nr:hypothetical protein [archaeon]
MDLLKAILWRRSIRRYKPEPVEQEKILELLKAAVWAPSAGNTQSWRFWVVKKPELKLELSRACNGQSHVREASHVILVGFNEDEARRAYGNRGVTLFAIQDTAAAIQNLILRATDLGLGTCWVGSFDEYKTRELLELPRNIKPVALVTVGYPAEKPESRRKDIKEVVRFTDDQTFI